MNFIDSLGFYTKIQSITKDSRITLLTSGNLGEVVLMDVKTCKVPLDSNTIIELIYCTGTPLELTGTLSIY